jgi:hypothetical protein
MVMTLAAGPKHGLSLQISPLARFYDGSSGQCETAAAGCRNNSSIVVVKFSPDTLLVATALMLSSGKDPSARSIASMWNRAKIHLRSAVSMWNRVKIHLRSAVSIWNRVKIHLWTACFDAESKRRSILQSTSKRNIVYATWNIQLKETLGSL